MKIIYKLIVVFLFALIIVSCSQEVGFEELNIRFVDHLVVDGMITTEVKEHKVMLYHSSEINSGDNYRMETGANVSITDGDTIVVLNEMHDGEYATSDDFSAKINKTYTLKVKLNNGEEYKASSYLYPSMVVDTLFALSTGKSYGIYMKVHGYGRVSYMFDVYLNDSLLTKNLRDKFNFNGQSYDNLCSIPVNLLAIGSSTVQVCMYSIPYQMSQFIYDVGNETWWSTEMFRTEQANVRTNISNGGLGFFVASDVLRKQLVIVRK